MTVYFRKYFNSFGVGFEFKCNGQKMNYYGYTKKQAIKKFRDDFDLKYKHLDIVEW